MKGPDEREPHARESMHGGPKRPSDPPRHAWEVAVARREQAVGQQKPPRVLVVDDSAQLRHDLAAKVAELGCAVVEADGGFAALRRLESEEFDLVLLDIEMPGLDGFKVLGFIRDRPALRHLPVVMVSALDTLDAVVHCIELGADDYLLKPWHEALLRARVHSCIERKRARDVERALLQRVEAERARADLLLGSIFPDAVLEELKQTGAVRPRRHDEVVVLFCDVVGFTAYCDRRSPEELVDALQAMVMEFETIAASHTLVKIKTIGDAFLATSGLLVPVANPVLAAVEAGRDMIRAAARPPCGWQVRVGIHVGPVLAGVVGARQYLFDVWGDTVNTASRVEHHGAIGKVTLSAEAHARVRDLVAATSLGPHDIKGKGSMELFAVD